MNQTYSSRLQAAIDRAGTSQYKLAQKSGVPQPTISRILKRISLNPKTETLEALAEALGVSHSWLILGEGPMDAGEAMEERRRFNDSEAHWSNRQQFDNAVTDMIADGVDPAAFFGISDEMLEPILNDETPVPEWMYRKVGIATHNPMPAASSSEVELLLAKATPRSRQQLLRIAEAAAEGRLSEADIKMLSDIAKRLEKGSTDHRDDYSNLKPDPADQDT